MAAPAAGERLGASYQYVRLLGRGAAGEVWEVARDGQPGRPFAAKVLRPEHVSDSGIVERFIRERSVLQQLRHDSIVAVEDLVVEGDTLAIVMHMIGGGSLRDHLNNHPTLAPKTALTVVSQVLFALDVAHANSVVHRDVKPDNVLLETAGDLSRVKMTDFGISSVLHSGPRTTTGLVGTPAYMAPELIQHGHATTAVDIYAAGIMLYEMLAGAPPFAGAGTDFTVAYRAVTEEAPPLDLGPELSAVWEFVQTLIAKDPAQRPNARAAAMRAAALAESTPDSAPARAAEPGWPPGGSAGGNTINGHAEPPATHLRTMLRPSGSAPEKTEQFATYHSPLIEHAPQLGESDGGTILRPFKEISRPAPKPETRVDHEKPWYKQPRALALIGGAATVLIGAGIAAALIFPLEPEVPDTPAVASAKTDALPSGLGNEWSLVAQGGEATVEVEFSAQKSPLSGEFLQAFAKLPGTERCPDLTWEGATATPLSAAVSGISAECGWQLEDLVIDAGGSKTVTAKFAGGFESDDAANEWLQDSLEATSEALNADVDSTSFVAQRLQDIEIAVPSRVVNQSTIEITLVPVWPQGSDPLNPMYRSPATGKPSRMLESITNGEAGVRFADGCAGAMAVSQDGLVATALSMQADCKVLGSVGNFTELSSNSFSITSRQNE